MRIHPYAGVIMMRDSNYEGVWCKGDGCEELCRVRVTTVDHLGGQYYCEDCREEGKVPEGHPQHPEFSGEFP